jgi:hypothetical protein
VAQNDLSSLGAFRIGLSDGLRLILIAANALLFAYMGYIVVSSGPSEWRHSSEYWFVMGLVICLGLNFIYLLLNRQTSNWRISRLISLWLDAKESELRKRANQSKVEGLKVRGGDVYVAMAKDQNCQPAARTARTL